MRIAIFGATGRTGRKLTWFAIEAGHEVTVLARTPALLYQEPKLRKKHERLTVVEGDVRDLDAVNRAMTHAEGVLCALDAREHELIVTGTERIVTSMRRHYQARRIVCASTAAIAAPSAGHARLLGRLTAEAVRRLFPRWVSAKEQQFRLLRQARVEWVLPRALRLVEGYRTAYYQSGALPLRPTDKISRADFADFMLLQLLQDDYLRQAPLVRY